MISKKDRTRVRQGMVYFRRDWITIEEKKEVLEAEREKILKGLVFYHGAWITIAEKKKMLSPSQDSTPLDPQPVVINQTFNNQTYNTTTTDNTQHSYDNHIDNRSVDNRTYNNHQTNDEHHKHVHVTMSQLRRELEKGGPLTEDDLPEKYTQKTREIPSIQKDNNNQNQYMDFSNSSDSSVNILSDTTNQRFTDHNTDYASMLKQDMNEQKAIPYDENMQKMVGHDEDYQKLLQHDENYQKTLPHDDEYTKMIELEKGLQEMIPKHRKYPKMPPANDLYAAAKFDDFTEMDQRITQVIKRDDILNPKKDKDK